MMDVFPILPTPLGVVKCPFYKEVKSLVLKEIAMKSGSSHTNQSGDFLYHLDYYSLLHEEKFKDLKEWIEEQGEIFVRDVMGHYLQEKMITTDSWVNICERGGKQHAHNHVNSLISGVYYVSKNDSHSSTYFVRKESMGAVNSVTATTPTISLPFEKQTEFNQEGEMQVNEGDLVLFPSTVLHGYKTNYEDDRVTIAMNLMPSVVCGWDYGWRVDTLTDKQRLSMQQKRNQGDLFLHPNLE